MKNEWLKTASKQKYIKISYVCRNITFITFHHTVNPGLNADLPLSCSSSLSLKVQPSKLADIHYLATFCLLIQ